jgi:hypothetical protein
MSALGYRLQVTGLVIARSVRGVFSGTSGKVVACGTRKAGLGYAACEYSLINPLRIGRR